MADTENAEENIQPHLLLVITRDRTVNVNLNKGKMLSKHYKGAASLPSLLTSIGK